MNWGRSSRNLLDRAQNPVLPQIGDSHGYIIKYVIKYDRQCFEIWHNQLPKYLARVFGVEKPHSRRE
jgi:hypothetical protein